MEPWAWWELLLYIFPLGIVAGVLLWVQHVRRNARSAPPEGWEKMISGSVIVYDEPPVLSLRVKHGISQDIKTLSTEELRACNKECNRYVDTCFKRYGMAATDQPDFRAASEFAVQVRRELVRRGVEL